MSRIPSNRIKTEQATAKVVTNAFALVTKKYIDITTVNVHGKVSMPLSVQPERNPFNPHNTATNTEMALLEVRYSANLKTYRQTKESETRPKIPPISSRFLNPNR